MKRNGTTLDSNFVIFQEITTFEETKIINNNKQKL